ncbi:hypothetical protein JX265_010514 [Neoarthrinium moseri]|uniref:Uncharacterized protein n=1 Tax=Neoarthrinium moseri TaxID=1658444 RepID=A0A9P9WE27_9PEZI|nr:hypothetical protein JX265_010514 [Neoarthrinium moseri]
MAAVLPPPPPPGPGAGQGPAGVFHRYENLPAELVNMIWDQYRLDPGVVHHHLLVHVHPGTRTMPRAYLCTDPFHRTVNDNPMVNRNPRHHPPTIGIPFSNGVVRHKIELPRGIRHRRPTTTWARRWDGYPQFRDLAVDMSPPHVYVHRHHDVFYFDNEFSYTANHYPHVQIARRTPLQFLSSHMSWGATRNAGELAAGGRFSWMRRIGKLAMRMERHPAPGYFARWFIDNAARIIALCTTLRRLYIVIDSLRPGCTLLSNLDDDNTAGRDGFVSYRTFLYRHRYARQFVPGHFCNCVLPPPELFDGAFPTLVRPPWMQDDTLLINLGIDVIIMLIRTSNAPYLANNWDFRHLEIRWVVDNS